MVSTVLGAGCVAATALAGLLLVRVGAGPSVCDRIVALNALSTQVTVAVMLFAGYADRSVYLDTALWLASFSYLATIVWSRYLERGLL